MTKISQLSADAAPTLTDYVPTVDVETGTTKRTLLSAIMSLILRAQNPVGTIYINATDSTNPATLFGFGTWVAFAAGRVPVGKASSGTFATIGATGGEEAHTLTTAELANHAHSLGMYTSGNEAGGYGLYPGAPMGFGDRAFVTASPGASSLGAGSGAAHNNLQPYITVYMWQRTA